MESLSLLVKKVKIRKSNKCIFDSKAKGQKIDQKIEKIDAYISKGTFMLLENVIA